MKKRVLKTLCIVCISTFLISCSAFSGNSDRANVTVSKAKIASSISDTTYTGNVVSSEEVSIIPSVSGKIQTVDVEVGQTVKAGDTLFTIDNTDLTYKFNQAQGSYDAAAATYDKTAGGSAKQAQTDAAQALEKAQNELKDATLAYDTAKSQYDDDTSVKSAQVAYDAAKSNYDRTNSLYEAGAVAEVTLEDATNKLDSAKAQLDIAIANSKTALSNAESRLSNAKASLSAASQNASITSEVTNPDNIASAKAQMDSAKAGLDLAKHQLENATVTSPIDGKVSVSNINAGELTPTQTPSMILVNENSVNVEIKVTETNINDVSVGMPAKISVPSTGLTYDGTIATVSPSADEKTGMFDVKIAIESPDESLKVGMITDVNLIDSNEDNFVLVPTECVLEEDGSSYLYVIDGDKLAKRKVTVGEIKNQYLEIKEGISEEDQIVINGSSNMKDGGAYNIVKSN